MDEAEYYHDHRYLVEEYVLRVSRRASIVVRCFAYGDVGLTVGFYTRCTRSRVLERLYVEAADFLTSIWREWRDRWGAAIFCDIPQSEEARSLREAIDEATRIQFEERPRPSAFDTGSEESEEDPTREDYTVCSEVSEADFGDYFDWGTHRD